MGKKKRTKTIEFTARAEELMEVMEGTAELMASMMNIQAEDTPEKIAA